jgi:hypothetical protein
LVGEKEEIPMSTELQEEAKRNSQARTSLILGVTSLILMVFNFVPGLLSALGFVGALAGLFAVLAGVRGLRAARGLDEQGRKSAIAGIAAGVLGLLVFIAVLASGILSTQREMESLLTPQPPQTFQKDDLVLTYPGSWTDLSQETCEQISQPELGLECLLAIGHPSRDGTNINLVRFGLGFELTPEFADELMWASFESSTSDVDLESRDIVEIGGQQAVRRVFSVPSSEASDGRAHILLVYLVNGPSVYQFTGWTPSADALSQHRSEIEEIIAGAHFGATP